MLSGMVELVGTNGFGQTQVQCQVRLTSVSYTQEKPCSAPAWLVFVPHMNDHVSFVSVLDSFATGEVHMNANVVVHATEM